MSIGERIIELRKNANLSQGQLASMLSVSRQAVSKWENDVASPDTLKLIQLADVLDTEVEYLATGKHSAPKSETVVQIQEKIVEVEKIVEKPVVKVVEKRIPQIIEKTITQVIEKPVLKRVIRVKYFRNPVEFALFGIVCFVIGMIIGLLL